MSVYNRRSGCEVVIVVAPLSLKRVDVVAERIVAVVLTFDGERIDITPVGRIVFVIRRVVLVVRCVVLVVACVVCVVTCVVLIVGRNNTLLLGANLTFETIVGS